MKRLNSSEICPSKMVVLWFAVWRNIAFLTTAVAVGLTGWLVAQNPAQEVPAPPTPVTDIAVPNPVPEVLGAAPGEVLTRGPIHEAFAKPAVEDYKEPPIVPKTPPALIEELPPDERPVGENVLWIPGYYAWDEDRLDFIWISGIYRDAPPGHAWVAGYWRSVPGGAQWVPGFWTVVEQPVPNANETIIEYLPEPPVTLEQGPTIPQPGENHFWIPGNWRYVNNKYAWQAGYWSVGQAGWIWVPAHYTWTPLGYVYVPGYWDYSLAQRGLAFAPVFFDAAYYANPVVYQPTVVLRSNFLTVHLWSRPRFAHYYFGDYYGNTYAQVGFRPWFAPLVANRAFYDPLFTYYSWQGRRVDPNWITHVEQRYEYVMNHDAARPPRTYREQYRLAQQPQYRQYVNNVNIVTSNNTIIDLGNARPERRNQAFGTEQDIVSLQVQNAALTANLEQVAAQVKQIPQAPIQLEKVKPEVRTRFANQAKQFREIAAQRQQLAGPRPSGVTTETVAPSTSGNPTTQTVTGDARTKTGVGKIRLPVVQPVADPEVVGRTRVPAVGQAGSDPAVVPGATTTPAEQANTKRGFPGVNKSADTSAGKNDTTPDTDIPTDRNPSRLGKNVPPGNPPAGIGPGVVGGSYDPGLAPADVILPGGNSVVPNPANVTGTGGSTLPNNTTTTTTPSPTNDGTANGSPSNSPNTTATTVPGQRTPTNGAFGQDQGPLVPPGQLAPGQQNPEVFNPRIADPNAPASSSNTPAFNPRQANPNNSSNPSTANSPGSGNTTDSSTAGGINSGTVNNNPNTTATTVPGQRTPTNGAFGQNQGPLVPPGQLAPGQRNPEVFNPRVADPNAAPGSKNAPAFNPRNADPTKSTNAPNARTNRNGAATNGSDINPGTNGTSTGGTSSSNNTVQPPMATGTKSTTPRSGQRAPTNGAFGQDQGPLVPPGQRAPGQQAPRSFNPRVADPNAAPGKNTPAFNPRQATPRPTTPAPSPAATPSRDTNPANPGNNPTKSNRTGKNPNGAAADGNDTSMNRLRGMPSGPNLNSGRPGVNPGINPVLGSNPSAGTKPNKDQLNPFLPNSNLVNRNLGTGSGNRSTAPPSSSIGANRATPSGNAALSNRASPANRNTRDRDRDRKQNPPPTTGLTTDLPIGPTGVITLPPRPGVSPLGPNIPR